MYDTCIRRVARCWYVGRGFRRFSKEEVDVRVDFRKKSGRSPFVSGCVVWHFSAFVEGCFLSVGQNGLLFSVAVLGSAYWILGIVILIFIIVIIICAWRRYRCGRVLNLVRSKWHRE